jgi:hypothetical protein
VADSWRVTADGFEIVADLGSRAGSPGVYTMTVYEDGGSGVSGHSALQLSVVVE